LGLNHDRNRAPKPDSFLAALWHACSRPSAATRAASASASLRLAVSSDSRAAFASAFARSASAVARAASSFTRCREAFARSASAVARPASSFTRCRAASASASLRWANASDAFAVKTSDFAPSSSFFGAPVSDTDGSFVAVGCEVLSLGAGRVVNEGEVFFLVTSAPEGVVVAADLRARTSRDISRQVRSSVLLASPPVFAKAMQCFLSASEKVGHACFICSRTPCSLLTHSSKVALSPAANGSADRLAIPRQTGRTSRVGMSSDRADKGGIIVIKITGTICPRSFLA